MLKKLSKYFHSELNKLRKKFPKVIKEVRGGWFTNRTTTS